MENQGNSEFALPEEFSEPNLSGAKVQYIKLKKADDKLKVRVLPPSKAQGGKVGLFWGEHYGWSGRNEQDSSKTTYKKFLCIEDRDYQTKMTKVECPACTYRATYEALRDTQKAEIEGKVEKAKAAAAAAGMSQADIASKASAYRAKLQGELKATNDWLKDHNCDRKVRLAVLNEQEQFCILSLPYGTFKKLSTEMEKVSKRKYPKTDVQISPAGRKGVWFTITRAGQASRDSDSVEVYEKENDEGAKVLVFHTVTDEQLKVAKEILPDLNTMRESLRLPADKISYLVELDKVGGGRADIDAVDAVFGKGSTATHQASAITPDFDAFAEALPAKVEAKVEEVVDLPTTKVTPKAEAPKAEVVAPVAPVATPAAAPTPLAPTVTNAAAMSAAQIDALFDV
jgi:hypothetical protein